MLDYRKLLQELQSIEFEASVTASSPRAICELLRRSKVVTDLSKAIRSGLLEENVIRLFVDQLLTKDSQSARFEYEFALSALCVAMEKLFTPFAEEYIRDLSRIKSPRFTLAAGIAKLCYEMRNRQPITIYKDQGGPALEVLRSNLACKEWQQNLRNNVCVIVNDSGFPKPSPYSIWTVPRSGQFTHLDDTLEPEGRFMRVPHA